MANILPVRAIPLLNFIRDHHDAMLVTQTPQGSQKVCWRNVEASLPLHRFNDDGGDGLRIDVAVE